MGHLPTAEQQVDDVADGNQKNYEQPYQLVVPTGEFGDRHIDKGEQPEQQIDYDQNFIEPHGYLPSRLYGLPVRWIAHRRTVELINFTTT